MLAGAWWPLALARADDSDDTVLLVRVEGDERIAIRLRAELRNAQWQVVELRPPRGGPSTRSLESLAKGRGARAVLRVRPAKPAVELWVVSATDPSTGSGELLTAAGAHADPGILALRVTEVLRARGLSPPAASDAISGGQNADDSAARQGNDAVSPAPGGAAANRSGTAAAPSSSGLPSTTSPASPFAQVPTPVPSANPNSEATDETAAPKPSEPVPPPGVEAPKPEPKPAEPEPARPASKADESAAPEEPDEEDAEDTSTAPFDPGPPALFQLELAPAFVWSPGGLGPSFDVFTDLRLQTLERFAFAVFVLVPLAQAPLRDNADNSASVRTFAVGGGVDLQLPFGTWQLRAGLGAAALITRMSGHAAGPPYAMKDLTLHTAAAIANVGAALRVTPSIALTGRALLGWAIPRLQPRVGTEEAASWGVPILALTLGVELGIPWSAGGGG